MLHRADFAVSIFLMTMKSQEKEKQMNGKDFKNWRLRCGLTVPEAAEALGVSRRTIFNLQARPIIPGPTRIATITVESEINCKKEAV